jgi:hypothetical protein
LKCQNFSTYCVNSEGFEGTTKADVFHRGEINGWLNERVNHKLPLVDSHVPKYGWFLKLTIAFAGLSDSTIECQQCAGKANVKALSSLGNSPTHINIEINPKTKTACP